MIKGNMTFTAVLAAGLFIAGSSDAEKPSVDTDALIKRGLELGPNLTVMPDIPDNIMREAEDAYGIIEESAVPMAEKFKESITFDNETGRFVFGSFFPEKAVNKKSSAGNGYLKDDERLYIFISSSMPENLLNKYCMDVDALGIGSNAVFVIRGCVPGGGFNGCEDFDPTVRFVRSFILGNGEAARSCQVWIDPILFDRYGVTEVPSFVYARGVNRSIDPGSEGDYGRLNGVPEWKKTVGDWSLEYHIKELGRLSGVESPGRYYSNR